ncbi:phage tail tape measure protein [Clostridioides sp. ES-S-0108-01]|uniref:phage tail tape measure protein n=1 Tax=Clostridioides sp. ES-S-0108-01 TaxID=2770773 RepID=UPI001D0CBDBF|nr:phage tail tape measure protein [Clostridioides sp. ES-S-0108-01]
MVGAALQRSASVLAGFGTSMEDSIALVVGMQESTQNAEKTGTALKSIAVNLAGVKASAKEGTLEANKTNKAFKQLANIDIWNKQTGEIKGTMDVLGELNTKWKDLNDDQRNGIAEAAAGKYHINSFVALMNNWKHVIAYQEQYKQGLMVGSSDKENKRFVDSAEGKMIQLSEGLKKLVTTTISTDMFKGVLDVAISFVNVLDKIVSGFEKIGMSIPLAVGSIGGLFATIKGLGTTGAIPNYFANTMNKLIPVDTKDTEKAIKSYVNSQAKLNNYQKQGLLPIVNYNKELGKMSNSYNKLSTNTERVISSNNKMNQSSVKGVKASKETANAMKENARSLYMINSASKDVNKLNNDTKRNLPVVNYNKETGKMVNDYNKLYISGQKVASVNNKVNESSMKGIKASKETANSMKQSAEAMKQNADARKESIRSLYAVNSASKKTGESANSASKGVNELNDGMKRSMVGSLLANTGVTLLNGAFLGLATAGISTAVKMIDEYVRRNEIAKEQAEERIQVAQDEINGYKNQKDGLKSIQKEYDTLYNKSNKTPEELERYKALTKEIAEMMPELVVGTDNDGNAILNMRGDVSDLISDLDEAIARKEALMAGDKEEAGKIALDELNEKDTGRVRKQGVNGFFDQVVNYKDAKEKLAGIQNETNSKIVETESKMNKALLMAQTENDGQREKALAEYQKYYEERQKIVDSGESEYQSKLNEIQKKSNEAGVGIFAGIKSDISFSDFTSKIQSEILSLQGSLDFSDFTREEFPKIQNAIMALGSSGIDLSNFKKSLDETNKAFQSGQISVGDYNKKIDELAKLASDGTGYDVDFWKDMLDGITQGSYEASRGVESFLKSFNKTDNDLRNGDSMAKTLKRQFEAVNNTLEDMMSPNLTKDMVEKYSQNKNLPKEISKMLSNFSIDEITGDEQAFAIKVMYAFQQGDTKEARQALEKINEELKAKGLDKIDIDALFNDKEAVEEIGAFETRLNQFKDKDIAIKIKDNTNIKSVKELDILDEQLNKFKDKDTKLNFIADCGQAFEGVNSLDEAIKNIPLKNLVKYDIDVSNDKKLQQMKNDYESLPKDAKYIIDTEVIGQEHVGKVKDMIEKLPTNREMTLKFMEENKDVIEDAKDYQDIFDNLAKNPDVALKYGIKIEGIEEFEKVKGLFDSITDKNLQKKFANFSIQYPDNIDVIKSLFDNAPSGKKEATLSFMIENADKLQMVQELFDKAPDEQKEAVINFVVNNLDKLNLIEQLYNDFPENKDIITNLIVNNPDALDEVKNLNDLDLDKDVKINIIKSLTNGDVNSLIAEIEKLPPEKQVKVIAAVEGAMNSINSVDKKTLKDKLAKLKADATDALNKHNQINNKKVKDKKTKITATDNATPTIASVKTGLDGIKNKSVTVTITEIWKKVTNFFTGGGGNNSNKNNTEHTSVTRGTPIPANLSTKPRTSEPAPISDETPVTKPSLFSRAVSRATTPIKTLTEKFSRITKTPKIALDTKSIDAAVKYSIELLKELENAISKVTDRISLLDKKMKYASGADNLKYLEEQNSLYKEELTLLDQKDKALNTQKNRLKDRLKKDYNYSFSGDENLTSYEEKLIALEKELEKLDKQSESDKGSKKSEERKKKIEEEKKVVEEYLKIAFTEIPKVADAQQEVKNALIESTRAAEEFKKELKEIGQEAALTSAQKHVTEIQNEIDLIDILMKNAEGDEKLDLIEKKKELLAKQAKEIKDVIKVYEDTAKDLREGLSKEGFEFSADGKSIKNYEQQLKMLKNELDADKYKEVAENAQKYLDLLLKDLPDANNQIQQNKEEIEALNKEIKDAYKEQLKEAQSLQEKIRDMYKKELEERLKEIDKETKAKIDSLKKQQDAYNDSRKEAKFKDELKEQQDVIDKLRKKEESLKRDTTLSGQKQLQEIQKQIKEEQKKLEELNQDHIDDQVNDMYDKEADRLQEEADKLKEELEKKYSDENLVDLINQAISSGKFVGLDGEVKKLQDAIIEYINKYEDGMLAMGSVTKQEWLDTLKEGKETLEDINGILDELDLSKFAMPNYTPPSNSRSRSASPTSSVNFNSPFFVVQGNVTKDTMKDLEKFGRDLENRVYRKIVENIKS